MKRIAGWLGLERRRKGELAPTFELFRLFREPAAGNPGGEMSARKFEAIFLGLPGLLFRNCRHNGAWRGGIGRISGSSRRRAGPVPPQCFL